MTYYEIFYGREGQTPTVNKQYQHRQYLIFAKQVMKLRGEGYEIINTTVKEDGISLILSLPPHTPPIPSAEPRCRKCNALMRDDQRVCSCGWDIAEYVEYLRKKLSSMVDKSDMGGRE